MPDDDVFDAALAQGRIVKDDGRLRMVADMQQWKRNKLLDILRRVIANPENLKEVADEIALDWFPMAQVAKDGSVSFVLGSGRKK